MEFVQSSQLYTGTGPDLIMKEHQRVIQNQNKLECDIKIICKDGDILYTKLLLYLMEPTLKCALIDRDDPDIKSPRVIIFPSQCINDIVNFYTDKVRIQHQPSLVEEASSGHELILQEQHDAVSNNFNDQHSQDKEGIQSSDVVDTNICEKCGVGYKSLKQLKAHQWSLIHAFLRVAVRHIMAITVGEVAEFLQAGVDASQGLIGASQNLDIIVAVALELSHLSDDF